MDKTLETFIERIKGIDDVKEYDKVLLELNQELLSNGYPEEFCQDVRNRQKYIKNRFSEEANKEKMLDAKDKVLDSLLRFVKREQANNRELILFLGNFYLFLESLRERDVDKRATLKISLLQQIEINNEYDLQHLLYAVLKPLYPDIRKEVSEDSGIGMNRCDLKIPSLNLVIEAKCTRETMTLKKLTEEIEADIVHYLEKNIVFFVYDKVKIIKEKQNYENHFNCIFDGKDVNIIILQPVNL